MAPAKQLSLFVSYVLSYCGAITYVWPLLAHFRHHDLVTSPWVEYIVRALVIPLCLGFMLATLSETTQAMKYLLAAGALLFALLLMSILEFLPYAGWDWSVPLATTVSCGASLGGVWMAERLRPIAS